MKADLGQDSCGVFGLIALMAMWVRGFGATVCDVVGDGGFAVFWGWCCG